MQFNKQTHFNQYYQFIQMYCSSSSHTVELSGNATPWKQFRLNTISAGLWRVVKYKTLPDEWCTLRAAAPVLHIRNTYFIGSPKQSFCIWDEYIGAGGYYAVKSCHHTHCSATTSCGCWSWDEKQWHVLFRFFSIPSSHPHPPKGSFWLCKVRHIWEDVQFVAVAVQ